ncbi:imidazolonepropionase [Agrilactobacillus composti]|nr:imidazolonepropionase [Agrilactobacillus composti]
MNRVLIENAAQIATPIGTCAKRGKQMNGLRLIETGSIYIEDGVIQQIGPSASVQQYLHESENQSEIYVIDASGQTLIPGLIDSHTHLMFAGERLDEFCQRLSGATYMAIMAAGGGIQNTVRATRLADPGLLLNESKRRLSEMLRFGVTTAEIKSGYGLDERTELEELTLIQQLNQDLDMDVVATFLGAHAIPLEFSGDGDGYINWIINTMLPKIAATHLAEYVDVFCDQGVFTLKQAERLLSAAIDYGFKIKIHADEIANLGGATLAAKLNATSADHLLRITSAEIRDLANRSRTIATLLPCTAFCLQEEFAPARQMIDSGCAVSLASDYNPGSAYTCSVPLMIALASVTMKMTPAEILTALTINAAAAIDRADSIGSLEVGKLADIVFLNVPDYRYMVYHTGMNDVVRVMKRGKVVDTNGEPENKNWYHRSISVK